MIETYEIAAALRSDWDGIAFLLDRGGLPLDGLEDHLGTTLVAKDRGRVIGCAALEIYGTDALLRSVAVEPGHRRRGVGVALTAAAIELARRREVHDIYLLTETAAEFFPRFGFEPTTRDAVPAAVKQSAEFTTACPASAAVMMLRMRFPEPTG
jgi:amino-acid N-acetyltransferase